MTSRYPITPPPPATRGQVQKIFSEIRVLSGFVDQNHLMQIVGEYFNEQSPEIQQSILDEAEQTRQFVGTLKPFLQTSAEIREITNDYVQALQADPVFQASFGNVIHRFAYVDPTKIIALQPWIEPRNDRLPDNEDELIQFALPNVFEVPAEVNFIPPNGPIQILSSNPMFQGLAIDFDAAAGKVSLGPPKHLNLTQVRRFQDRYYLFNGYHRLADAVRAGVREFPCLIVDAFSPADLLINDPRFFNIGYIVTLMRPPLVADFNSPAALTTKIRERRYGMIIDLDIKPINIGI